MYRKLLLREPFAIPWRELPWVFWRLEARCGVRGGRSLSGVSGEQFALLEAVGQLRAVRRRDKTGELISISTGDPLNLTGVLTAEARVSALSGNGLVFEDGVLVAVREARKTQVLKETAPERALEVERVLARKRVGPALRARLGMAG